MQKERQIQYAKQFQELHHNNQLLVLPNVWDVGSAKIFEKSGFKAIATTSAGIAYSMGYPDGEHLTIDDLETLTRKITQRIDIPLSVDLEKGYADNAEQVKYNARKLIKAGTVGVNIEDGNNTERPYLDELSLMQEKIKALSELKKEIGIPFVINARSDVFWLQIGNENDRLKLAIERAKAFINVGADCIFLPGAITKESVKILLDNIDCPLNIIANPAFNDLKEMENIGVSRLSIGSGAIRSVLEHTQNIAQELKSNSLNTMLSTQLSYQKANQIFEIK
ncbi:isocitrate lyase/PEP mutase family protein [Aquimarina sp. 2201CG14-23]|uniref:isocitrate lyase/PEP mutase family protein n=1 Tax=Aquimarina mycalae TaxID=3040073 RepID=UPI002477E59B|nr:isocitrate lyase/phosphoenolpyruvate mutase family protein [Aquimarina sp. 2201CG14-23]MDH7448470.1 isocitrate lyase/phosphoenolpyruvate mutase family protein [Aquimarina sp. 2201CG14-23]